MKAQTIELKTPRSAEYIYNTAKRVLNSEVKDKKRRIECVIRNALSKKEMRSDAQNRINWKWCGEEANFNNMRDKHIGKEYTPEQIHRINKLDYGLPILLRDEDFSQFWQPYRDRDREFKLKAMKYLPVTSIMEIDQMTEYLATLKQHKEANGIKLTDTSEEYFEAMGWTK